MYPYLWLRLRRAFKSAWNRYNSSKRERTTSFSSLQECLDHQSDRRGLWRNWFLLLLVAPLVYYVTFIHIVWGDGSNNITSIKSEQQVTEKIKVKNILLQTQLKTSLLKKYLENQITTQVVREVPALHTPRFEDVYDGSYYNYVSRIVAKSAHNATPWCEYHPQLIQKSKLEVKVNNITVSQWYRQLVNPGGSFSPSYCIPRHKVAIIVPYRDRPSNLAVFLLTIHPFLIDQLLDYRIFVVEQSGKDLFNKGRLFNAGFVEAMKLGKWQCLIFHDLDLLPTSKQITYSCPLWPRHMCATVIENGTTVRNYHSFFGGVSSMTVKQFKSVNGFSNLYWGWGGEDTDMFWRIRGAGLIMGRYQKDVAKYIILPHERGPECVNRNELVKTAFERYPYDGLTTLKYRVVSMKFLHLYTHILVDINPRTDEASPAPAASSHNVLL